ncbi:MAG: DUF4010 domain-containing protein [Burkholderiaceae bacterium]
MDQSATLLMGLALALGCGLLIGIERERRKGTGPQRQFAGVRTFALTALLGAGTQALEQPLLLFAAGLLVAGLGVVSSWRDRSDDPGVTTEVALFVTFLLGVMSLQAPVVAAAGAVVVSGLLAARTAVQRFSTQTLTEREFRSALVLAAAALIILPLTPDRAIAWLGGVNPYMVWRLVVVMMLLQSAGHIALRLAGPRMGLALSGLASGFVSSTATVAAMGALARQQPGVTMACVCGALLSTVATSLQIGLISLVIQPGLLRGLVPSLACALLASLLVSGLAFRRSDTQSEPIAHRDAFSVWQSVVLALLLSGLTALVGWAQTAYGQTAIFAATGLAALADAHAAVAAVMSLAAKDASQTSLVLPAVLLAFTTNSLSKIVAAYSAGGVRYGNLTTSGLVTVAVAVWLPWGWSRSMG